MKKLFTFVLALVMVLSLSVTAFATGNTVNQSSASQTGSTTVTYTVNPAYTVTIPANTTVTFNTLSTAFGAVKLDAARIEPGYAVKVEMNASGTLKNQADAAKTIAYSIQDANGDAFAAGTYTTAGDKTDLTINITQAAWNGAFAGQYSDTVTFTVSYINTVTP